MVSLSISLPDKLNAFDDAQVAEQGYTSASEYVREPIRQRRRAQAEERLRSLSAQRLASGPAEPLEPDFCDRTRVEARTRAAR